MSEDQKQKLWSMANDANLSICELVRQLLFSPEAEKLREYVMENLSPDEETDRYWETIRVINP